MAGPPMLSLAMIRKTLILLTIETYATPLSASINSSRLCRFPQATLQHVVQAIDSSLPSLHQLSDDVRADEARPASG